MINSELNIGVYDADDHIIATCIETSKPALDIYSPNDISVVLGRGSNPETELHIPACIEDGVRVLRRHGGGCAVVLDPGNVIVSLTLPLNGFFRINEYFSAISAWLIDGLAACGLDNVYHEGHSDLVYDNRKIAGACMQRKRHHVYYSASLLFNSDTDLMDKYLKHPPREPAYRNGRSHNEFNIICCETFHNVLKSYCPFDTIVSALSHLLGPRFGGFYGFDSR